MVLFISVFLFSLHLERNISTCDERGKSLQIWREWSVLFALKRSHRRRMCLRAFADMYFIPIASIDGWPTREYDRESCPFFSELAGLFQLEFLTSPGLHRKLAPYAVLTSPGPRYTESISVASRLLQTMGPAGQFVWIQRLTSRILSSRGRL